MNNHTKWQPFIYGLLIAAGISIGIWLKPATGNRTLLFGSKTKFSEVINIINQAYVDTVNMEELEETTLNELLNKLDPHSVYIPAKDLKMANEQLEGNFEGIGVEFNILNDTIMVVSALNGGPSKELGIMPGDRIIEVDGKKVSGIDITNEQVFKLLRGKKDTKVKVVVYRPDSKKMIDYTITRGTIPIYSVDVSMMLSDETGYIKISRFAADTHDEFLKAFESLKNQHMRNLVIDLRGNPGGYLSAATEIADELLGDKKLIVYTQGRMQPRGEYNAERPGVFENGKLIVLIDEGSASASEILSGAVQDWDRGVVVGRRSFGKGLVQEPFELKDGSALRLTISRYYTPSGRCIQKPYETGYEAYEHEIVNRFDNGELEDSSKFQSTDTTIFYTANGRKVYSRGGIMPDVFVPVDTSYRTTFWVEVLSNSLLNQFTASYVDRNRKIFSSYKDAVAFNQQFNHQIPWNEFLAYAADKGVSPKGNDLVRSEKFIRTHMKALIARQLFRDEGYFTVVNTTDPVIQRALSCLTNYNELLNGK